MVDAAALYQRFAQIVRQLRRDVDYEVDEEKRTVAPTEVGIHKVETVLGIENPLRRAGRPTSCTSSRCGP
ncbi:MAG: hypothetical protein R2755_03885 [Acidimicrobiales bacterium]